MPVGRKLSEVVQSIPEEAFLRIPVCALSGSAFFGLPVDADNPCPTVGQCQHSEQLPNPIRPGHVNGFQPEAPRLERCTQRFDLPSLPVQVHHRIGADLPTDSDQKRAVFQALCDHLTIDRLSPSKSLQPIEMRGLLWSASPGKHLDRNTPWKTLRWGRSYTAVFPRPDHEGNSRTGSRRESPSLSVPSGSLLP